MGATTAEKARQILENTEYIVAIELLCVAQAIELRGSEKLGKGTKIAYSTIRKTVTMLKEDRVLNEDVEKIKRIIKKHVILDEIERARVWVQLMEALLHENAYSNRETRLATVKS